MGAQTEKEVKQMNPCRGERVLRTACRRKQINQILEQYILSCRYEVEENEGERSRSRRSKDRFPNLAGFCRYLKIGTHELEMLSHEFPHEMEELYLTLEDEALNSGLPPALLSAYLKKRLGYEKELHTIEEAPLQICFEHDIFEDGE